MTVNHPRFLRIRRNRSKPLSIDLADHINTYWRLRVAHASNDDGVRTAGTLKNGVPVAAITQPDTYKHDAIVWMRWNGKKLEIVK